jgi:mRNA-degrading endonuclease RelE of RelBE toxin-antitoxin system
LASSYGPHYSVEWTDAALQGIRSLTRGQQRHVADKTEELAFKPLAGAHKERELYCYRSLRISHIRVVYKLSLRDSIATIVAVAPHDEAYEQAFQYRDA